MNYKGIPEQKIREALSFLDYEDQDIWIKAGMAIQHELGESGLDMWLAWSSLGSTYNQKSAIGRWKTFKNKRGITIGTLIYLAQKEGFRFEDGMMRISQKQIQEREQRQKEAQAKAEQEAVNEAQKYAQAATKAQKIWNQSKPVESHPYLTKKDVCAHGVRVGKWTYRDDKEQLQTEENALIIPLYFRGNMVSVQAVFPNRVATPQGIRDKFYLYGAQKSGVCSFIGELTDTILICEGWATGATLHEATQLYVAVALDAGNMPNVAKEIRKSHPFARIVICADNDQYKRSNTGIKKAVEAACEVDADVVYPVFKDTKNKPTDFNDLYHEEGSFDAVYERVITPRMFRLEPNNKVPALNAFDLPYIADPEKVLEESSNYLEVARAALYAGLRLSESCPAFATVDQIRNYIQHPLINHKTHLSIMRRIQWAIHARKRIALSAIKPEKWGKHDHVVVDTLEGLELKDGVNLIFAPMGSGKTQKVIKPFSEADKVFCAIAHRRSLISELSKRLNVDNYEETKDVFMSEKVAVCLPSSQSLRFREFNKRVVNLAIDEISQNIRFTSSKECKATGVDQEGVYMGLKDLVNKSACIVAADASIDQTTLDFFEQARPDEKFTIIEQIPNNKLEKKCFLYDEETLLSRVQVELMNGGNVWFAVESVAKAEAIHALFGGMLITSKNSQSKRVKDFLSNVEDESRKYNLVIASPAISSGVSVEHGVMPHFTMIAGIASGAAICFSDFAQMLARVRYVNHYHVCLKKNNHKYDGVTAHTILLGQRQAAMLEGAKLKENEYTQVMAGIDERERAYRADFANGFIWFLQYYCFEILPAPQTQMDYTLLDKLKEITKENKQAYRQALCEAEIIDQDQADKLDQKKDLTEDEQVVLMAFNIKKLLGYTHVHELTLLDIEMFERLPAIDRFARYLGLVPKVDDTDKNIALRKFANAQVKATELMFGEHKLNDTFFTPDICKKIVKNVCSNDHRFMLSALKLVPSSYARDIQDKQGNLKPLRVPDNCSKSMGAILEKFGLKWKRHTKGHSRNGNIGYQVSEESFEIMKKYALQRYAHQA